MNADVLRILDANANRAREALRVLEDYARFILNDEILCGGLKSLRHDFAGATAAFLQDAILHRDTPGDVGTATKTEPELRRDDVGHVVTAAGKRLGEALRTIEEYSKTFDPIAAAKIERIRYRFYDLEQQLARTLRPAGCGLASVRLYVLMTESQCSSQWLQAAERAIEGGADCIQLREKELESGDLLRRAHQLVDLCRRRNVLCIINDRPDIAILAGADGVHVGQADLPASQVRKIIGSNKIVGVSTHNLDQARQAVRDGADYIGVGPVFRSSTKPRDFLPGLDFASQVAAANLPIPAIAIAGITLQNVDKVIATGVQAVAVTAAIVGAADIGEAAKQFKSRFEAIKREKDVPSSCANH
jgi:thiamine-phosphate pyrophosphorylase